jgi:hypothetical protein
MKFEFVFDPATNPYPLKKPRISSNGIPARQTFTVGGADAALKIVDWAT